MKKVLAIVIFILPSLLFGMKQPETKPLTVTVLQMPLEKSTETENFQLAWMKAKFKCAAAIRDYFKDEYELEKYISDPEEQLKVAFIMIWYYDVIEEQNVNGSLTLHFTGEIALKTIEGMITNAAKGKNPYYHEKLDIYLYAKTLLDDMTAFHKELLETVDYNLDVKQVRITRAALDRKFQSYEFYCKSRNYQRYDHKRDDDKQVELLSRAVEYASREPLMYRLRAMAQMSREDTPYYDMALRDIDTAIKMLPDALALYSERAHIYSRMKVYDKALADYDYIIDQTDDFAEPYRSKAYVYKSMKEYGKALKETKRAMKIEPDNANHYNIMGSIYSSDRKYKKAVKAYTQGIEIDPEYKFCWSGRANAYVMWGKLDEAIADYNKCIELEPDDDYNYLGRGNAYMKKGDMEKAKADYQKAADMGNEHAEKLLKQF